MIWNALYQLASILIQWLALLRRSKSEKDLEILILRHQLDVLQRQQAKPIRPSRPDKFTLTLLTKQLKTTSKRTIRELGNTIVIVKPKTIFKWHQEMVRRKWARYAKKKRGHPKTSPEVRKLVLQMAQENGWGKERLADEIGKLGHDICPETVRNILNEHHVPPAPIVILHPVGDI